MPEAPPGNYSLTITLRDHNEVLPKESKFSFDLILIDQVVTYATFNESITDEENSPSLKIDSISNKGVVVIKFTQNLVIVTNLTTIDPDVLLLSIETGEKRDPRYSNFTWEVTDFTTSDITIKIRFSHAVWISSDMIRDILWI